MDPTPQFLAQLAAVATGRSLADLVIRGATVYNVFTGEFKPLDVAIFDDLIAGLGPSGSYRGRREIIVKGYLTPGFIDSHVHIESAMASPQSLAPLLLENGVTAVVADPHEIANVCGLMGLEWCFLAGKAAPLDFYFTLPSCVPATDLEKGGATLLAEDLRPYFERPKVVGLAEMMNYPGAIGGEPRVLAKMAAAWAARLPIDGHAPTVTGPDLVAYRALGVASDHEAASAAEAAEKLALGFWLMIREGTAAKNLLSLWPAVTSHNARFCLFATDDRHVRDLVLEGSINHLVRLAAKRSPDRLADILNMATINPAQYFGFRNNGAISPGFIADLALYPDLTSWTPEKVWKNGRLVVDGTYQGLALDPDPALDAELLNSVKVKPLVLDSLKVPATGSKVRVIGLTYGQLLTESLALSWPATNGYYEAHIDLDIVKMVVWNRYDGDGRGQVGFLKGLKMTKGALAQTISHDSHQLVAAGTNDEDLLLAAQTVADLGGGLALALNGQVLGSLALPLGGLMSHVPARELARALDELDEKGRLCGFQKGLDPFLALGFMSLPVIPRLKLTERGLIEDFQVVDLVLA